MVWEDSIKMLSHLKFSEVKSVFTNNFRILLKMLTKKIPDIKKFYFVKYTNKNILNTCV